MFYRKKMKLCKRNELCLFLLLNVCILFFFAFFAHAKPLAPSSHVNVLTLDGVINPVSAQYIIRGIEQSEKDSAECVVIRLDTPGGLDTSMRKIIQKMLDSKIPVIVYVWPKGARGASAGAFIGIASDILVMSPGTAIGAAHPVAMGKEMKGAMNDKVTNDAAAYIKSLAKMKHRNAVWAEKAVRKSKSLNEQEAVNEKIADFVAPDVKELLKKIHGRKVKMASGDVALNTKDAEIKNLDMMFYEKFLHAITDPNVAYVLMMIAVYGIIYEFAVPGATLPGVVGGICLLLALYGLGSLPVNLTGVLFILFAFLLFIAEVKVPSYGVLGVGGIISMILGSLLLFGQKSPYIAVRVSVQTIAGVVLFSLFFFFVAVTVGIRALKMKVTSGREGLPGRMGIVKTTLDPIGVVNVEGEEYTADSMEGRIEAGEKIQIVEIAGLKARVKKA